MLESQKDLFKGQNTRVISVNLDDPSHAKSVRTYSNNEGFTFMIVINETEKKNYGVVETYGVLGTPISYLIDAGGTIVDAHYGVRPPQELEATLDKLP